MLRRTNKTSGAGSRSDLPSSWWWRFRGWGVDEARPTARAYPGQRETAVSLVEDYVRYEVCVSVRDQCLTFSNG